VDELGYLPLARQAGHLLFHLVRRRYEKGSLMMTSNQPIGAWGEALGDPVVATAILDRLLHHSHVLTIKVDSYRLREKRSAGIVPATEVAG
jgi:DNA replication protein DnaC